MEEYYIPTIEEFHIGFIYEDMQYRPVKTPIGIAKRRMFGEMTLNTTKPFWEIKKDIEDGDIRVKYLTKEDIESLDFKFEGGKMIKNVSDTFIHKSGYYRLGYQYKSKKIQIYHRDGEMVEHLIIKNKSELIRLLTQLTVN